MSYVSHLRGLGSGAEYPADQLMNLDPVDGRPVEMVLDLDRLRLTIRACRGTTRSGRDLWRFGALMALDAFDPDDARWIVPLGEGHTPLRELARTRWPRGRASGSSSRTRARPNPASAPTRRSRSRTGAWR